MASVNTNAAAITALRTLQQTNKSLDMTQSRISTGYKIGEAKDNAAYWAISTTLKSDNKSLATVKDALNLGSSTVDVAYQGLNKAKDVLDEIKSKLTAATQDGINRDTIQGEIKQLQDQLKSIATSSVFSGENWLSVDSSAASYSSQKTVVASFARDAAGSVSIGTIGINAAGLSLFDANVDTAKSGIVDAKANLVAGTGKQLAYGGSLAPSATGNISTAGLVDGTDTGFTAAALTDAGAVATKASIGFTGLTIPGGGADFSGAPGADGITFTFNEVTINASTGAQTTTPRTVTILGNHLNGVTGAAIGNGDAKLDNINELVAAFNKVSAIGSFNLEAYADGGAFAVRNTQQGALFGVQATANAAVAGSGSALNLSRADALVHLGDGNAQITSTSLNLTHFASNATDKIQLSFKFDGGVTKTYDVTAGASLTTLVAALNAAGDFSTYAQASQSGGELVITGKTLGADKTVELTGVTYTDSGSVSKEIATATGLPYSEKAKVASGTFTGPITLDDDDKIQFDITVNGGASQLVTIDKATIDAALSVNTGTINTASNYVTVLNKALTNAGVTGVVSSVGVIGADAGKVIFTTSARGNTAAVAIANAGATKGAMKMSVDTMDISAATMKALGADTGDKIREVISAYVAIVNAAINKVTSAASSLGSVASRIDIQKSFVDTLMDTIDKGVGNLIDADMSEESTKLQALQVKQQLGVQALSIANQSSQNILSLFRS